jgi:hypothetical protein
MSDLLLTNLATPSTHLPSTAPVGQSTPSRIDERGGLRASIQQLPSVTPPARTTRSASLPPRQNLTRQMAAAIRVPTQTSSQQSPSAVLTASPKDAQSLAEMLEHMKHLGLDRPAVPAVTLQPAKNPVHTGELGMGLPRSNIGDLLKTVLDVKPADPPKDRKAKRAKNTQLNNALSEVKKINAELDELYDIGFDHQNAVIDASVEDMEAHGEVNSGVFHRRALQEMRRHIDEPLKKLTQALIEQAARLKAFPELAQSDQPTSKREQFLYEIVKGIGCVNSLRMLTPYLSMSDQSLPEFRVSLLREIVGRAVAMGERVDMPTLQQIKDCNASMTTTMPQARVEAWQRIATVHDGLLTDRQIPQETGLRLQLSVRCGLVRALLMSLPAVMEMQFKITLRQRAMQGVYSALECSPAEEAEKFAKAAQIHNLTSERGDSEYDCFNDEIDSLKELLDHTVTALTAALRLELPSVDLKAADTARIDTYAKSIQDIATAFDELILSAPQAYAADGQSAASRFELEANLKFAAYVANLFADLASERSSLAAHKLAQAARDAQDVAMPAEVLYTQKPEQSGITEQAFATTESTTKSLDSKSSSVTTRTEAPRRSFQEVQTMIRSDRELSDALMAKGQAHRGRHLSALRRFRAAELIGFAALASAADCFERAAALRRRALKTVATEPYTLLAEEVRAELERAERLAVGARRFAASPKSKPLLPKVLLELETTNELTLGRAKVVQTRGGGWIVEIPMKINGFEGEHPDRQLWLHMHLRDNVEIRDPRLLRSHHFVEDRPNAVSIKRDEERKETYEASGEKARRNPVPLDYALGAMRRSLGFEEDSTMD